MRKKRRLFVLAGMVCLVMGSLSGCKKVTAISLLTDAAKNVKDIKSYQGTMDMEMEMGIAQSGMSMGMDINMSMDIEAMKDPSTYHMSGEMGMDLMDLSVDMEMYGEVKDDEAVVYVNIADEWMKETVDVEDVEGMDEILDLDGYVAQNKELKLAEKTEKENGKEVYVITTTLDGEDFNDTMDNFTEFMEDDMMGNMDFSSFTADVTLKIYKDTKLPAAICMEMNGDSSAVFEQDGVEMSLKGISYEIKIDEYNKVKSIDIPKEALQATETSDVSDDFLEESTGSFDDSDLNSGLIQDENGNYILSDYDGQKSVAIAVPEGYAIESYSSDTYLDFTSESDDAYTSLSYNIEDLTEYFTEEDLIEDYSDDLEYYSEEDGYKDVKSEDIKSVKVGDYEVKYLSYSFNNNDIYWGRDIYAWTVLDDGFAVCCEIMETDYEDGSSIVGEAEVKKAFEALR